MKQGHSKGGNRRPQGSGQQTARKKEERFQIHTNSFPLAPPKTSGELCLCEVKGPDELDALQDEYWTDGARLVVFSGTAPPPKFECNVRYSGTYRELLEEDVDRAEAVLSILSRNPKFGRVGRRIGTASSRYEKSEFMEWIHLRSQTLVCQTLVLDVAAELVTTRDIPVLEFWRLMKCDDRRQQLAMLEGLKLRKTVGPKRDFRCIGLEKDGEVKELDVSVREYFKTEYDFRTRDARILCHRHRKDGSERGFALYYPVEAVVVKKGQKIPQSSFGDEVLRRNCMQPDQRLKDIMHQVNQVNELQALKSVGVSVLSKALRPEAMGLVSPVLMQGRNRTIDREPEWRPGFPLNKAPRQSIDWVMVVFSGAGDQKQVMRAMEGEMVLECQKIGLNLSRKGHLVEVKNAAALSVRSAPLVFVLLDRPNSRDYDIVKKKMHAAGVVSQCMVRAKFMKEKGRGNYCKMVALKLNVKLRGTNLALQLERNSPLLDADTLVLGMDVHHPPVGATAPSVAALVGSTDASFQVYQGTFEACPKERQELGSLTKAMIEPFRRRRPKRILFYRDGVGKQSLDQVKDREVPLLKEAFPGVPITVIVMTKRHNHRLFKPDGQNVEAGTLIMGDGTFLPKGSFILNAHVPRLGTNHSAKYIVLQNDLKWSHDNLGRVSYQLAHLHARATKSVSMPAPLYQAHLLAYAARHYKRTEDVKTGGMWWN